MSFRRRNLPARRPRNWSRGQPVTARRLQEPVQALQQLLGGVDPARVRATSGAASVPGGLDIGQARVKEVQNDSLSCVAFNGTGEVGEPFIVAKPYLLRRTPFDGLTVNGVSYAYSSATTRVATDAADATVTETQVVTPAYNVNDVIFVARNVTRNTGIVVSDKQITRLDINVDARAWAVEATAE